ncbi:hypothetical protein ITI46_30905 [Streptomyces oryzae]|uniref:Integral membrane protein n=1 Tax=Streptomyces oryzae TaxID=1434886 RepID=A0ABS3XKX9_9ACTN|nr:hypothetical protein [Streptomyces oryzae]MBO8196024.1 hypothetical protein [Streptomyces oryzae]
MHRAGRFLAALRARTDRRGDLAAGCVLIAAGALLAADAALAAAGLPGAAPFAAFLAVAAAVAALAELRACAGYRAYGGDGWRGPAGDAAARAVRGLPGSALVLLALCTAGGGGCGWAVPPLVVPGAGAAGGRADRCGAAPAVTPVRAATERNRRGRRTLAP